MLAYRKFSDARRGQLVTSPAPKPAKSPKAEPVVQSALGSLGTLGGVKAQPKSLEPAVSPDPQLWRELLQRRTEHYIGTHEPAEAELLAWGYLQNRWHLEQGERLSPHRCAGCGEFLGGAEALDLIDGTRVHIAPDCLIRYGERWRSAATRGLIDLGLRPPVGTDVP